MGNMQIGGIVMEKIGISSKTVKNLQDMEKITPEPITLRMEKQQIGGMMMEQIGIFSKTVRN